MMSPDPDRAYAAWAVHAERCPRCARAGELAPHHLCPRGQMLLQVWLDCERVLSAALGGRSRSFGDQMRINPEPATV